MSDLHVELDRLFKSAVNAASAAEAAIFADEFNRLLGNCDKNGWHVPRPGTLGRRVYEMTVAGKSTNECAAALGISKGTTRTTRWRIKNPRRRL